MSFWRIDYLKTEAAIILQINCLCDVLLLALAINMLKDQEPGAFVIRDSHSFKGAYGLAMKVASPPPTMQPTKKGISCASSRHAANADNHLPDVFPPGS